MATLIQRASTSDAPDSGPALNSDLQFIAFTIGVPLALVVVLCGVFALLGHVFFAASVVTGDAANQAASGWVLSFAILATYLICLPLLVVGLIRHFGKE